MLNFLEQKNRKQIISEYVMRVIVYFLFFVFLTILFLTVFFMPSYFFVKYKYETVDQQLSLMNKKSAGKIEDPITYIKNVNKFLTVLTTDSKDKVAYKSVVDKIISLKNQNIKIYSIIIDGNQKGDKIILNGIAKTREGLTDFNNKLKLDGFFDSVDFPVASFIKSTDAEFSATLIL